MRIQTLPRTVAASVFFLILAVASGGVAAQTCIQSGGKSFCGSPRPGAWGVGACDEGPLFNTRKMEWCRASGGQVINPGPSFGCVGNTPHTDDNIVARSIAWANGVNFGAATCAATLTTDTGYGITVTAGCAMPTDVYESGHLRTTGRRLTLRCTGPNGPGGPGNGGEMVTIMKTRSLACPTGYAPVSAPGIGTLCARTLEDCSDCKLANPITPLTGVKVETETDYRHAQGLQLSRSYHSMGFYEPHSNANGAHTENRFGAVWRSNYDKRVVPITPAHATLKHAMSLPSGEVQFFDQNGVEQYNYRGGSGTLLAVPGTGYYYRGPDATEFYDVNGRLRTVTQRTGQVLTLAYSDGTSGPNGGFVADAAGNPTNAVLPANRLIRVTDSYGNALSFSLNIGGAIVRMVDSGGGEYRYAYDAAENLLGVTYPDTRARSYRYNEPANVAASLPNALTSIVDENNDVFATFKYDASGRAVSTERAGATQRYQVTYNANGTSTVNDPLNTPRTFGATATDGIARFTGTSEQGGASYGAGVKARTYNAAGNAESQTNFNDIKTCSAYLAGRNLETVRVEGVPAATSCASVLASGASLPAGSRKITTDWHARWRLPMRVAEPLRRTTFAYNGDGASCAPGAATIDEGGGTSTPIAVLCSRGVQATTDVDGAQGVGATASGGPRESSFTYNETGQVLTANGPRIDVADVTAHAYGTDGNVSSVSNALSQTTSVTSYNPHGQPLTMIDANGLTTTLVYDARQRLSSRTVGSEVTSYDYDNAGQLIKVTLRDGSFLNYDYDAAHRLTGISDNLGNSIAYTLDAMGNRTAEQVLDPSNVLAQARSREFSSLNRLFKEFGAQNQTTEYAYDNQGNVLSVRDPLNKVTTNQYDALNRLKQVTDPGLGDTHYGYNGLDALTSVSDPRSLVTGYAVDGLGNLNQQVSPDTGTTTNTYDAAGNLLTQTDAKGQVTTYAYDALNRVTLITFHDGSKQAYAYDAGANGIGRLRSITELDPASQQTNLITYAYDLHGRVLSISTAHAGQVYSLGYSYDLSGRLAGLTYPSGRTVTYGFDALGRVNEITTTKDSQSQAVVQNVQYHPFGGVKGYTLGNGQAYARSIDLDGRISTYTLGIKTFGIGYDLASRIEQITDLATASFNSYGYDALDRLTSATIPGTPFSYSYDAVGNRTSKTVGASTDTYDYSLASNRIASVGARSFIFDANGSTTNDGNNTYAYDARGRMVQATSSLGATGYKVNALGQRIRKTNSLGDTVFHYDTNGKLIAETDPGGGVKREIFYLGDIPVGVIQ